MLLRYFRIITARAERALSSPPCASTYAAQARRRMFCAVWLGNGSCSTAARSRAVRSNQALTCVRAVGRGVRGPRQDLPVDGVGIRGEEPPVLFEEGIHPRVDLRGCTASRRGWQAPRGGRRRPDGPRPSPDTGGRRPAAPLSGPGRPRAAGPAGPPRPAAPTGAGRHRTARSPSRPLNQFRSTPPTLLSRIRCPASGSRPDRHRRAAEPRRFRRAPSSGARTARSLPTSSRGSRGRGPRGFGALP